MILRIPDYFYPLQKMGVNFEDWIFIENDDDIYPKQGGYSSGLIILDPEMKYFRIKIAAGEHLINQWKLKNYLSNLFIPDSQITNLQHPP